MTLLAIDTSTDVASLALFSSGDYFAQVEEARHLHAQNLLPMIDSLLLRANTRLNQLKGIVFGQGPGSFTGLRIACSLAKGLAYAQDIPLFPVSTLDAIVFELRATRPEYQDVGVLAVIDARMNQMYWRYDSPVGQVAVDAVSSAATLDFIAQQPIVLTGVGYEPYMAQLPPSISAALIDKLPCYPSALAMLKMVALRGGTGVSASDARPVYIRNQVIQGESHG